MKKNKSHTKLLLAVIPAAALTAAGIFFLYSRFSQNNYECAETIALLENLEAADVSPTEKKLQELKVLEGGSDEVDGSSEENGYSGTVLSTVELKQAFQGSVIVGDSITESIVEYGYLDSDVVISKRGLRIDEAGEQLDTAIGLHPINLFLVFGANDLELYEGDSQRFIDAYRTKVEMLQEALPDTALYINSILPVQQATIEQIPSLGYYPEFNQALETFCQEMGCTFIDPSFLVEGKDEMYEPDGEHVIADYYPQWLSYMAEMAGMI